MAPAFSSPRQSAAFALLLALIILAPALVARTGWLHRRDVYPAIPWIYGPSPWIQQKIFSESGDADIVFMGSSHIWNAINDLYVQKTLSERLGRKAEVFTLGWPWSGFDALYVIGRDLLDHRHVRMLVINDDGGEDMPHNYSSRWFRIGENSEALAGLSPVAQARLYGGAVLGMPRTLLSLIRPNLIEDPLHARENYWNTYYHAPNLAANRGSLRARLLYPLDPGFVSYVPQGDATPADTVVYSTKTADQFLFPNQPAHAYQMHFIRKLARLCRERGTRLVILNLPTASIHPRRIIVRAPELRPSLLGAPADLVGIPPARLFAGITPHDLILLFYDNAHLNQNGQDFYTPLITPVLLELYESTPRN